jgi:glycosyltransferase involved in cell wall biosynthesis
MTAERALPVISLGFVNLDRLPEVYCGADVLLHPAEADPHPLVMSEAGCIGLPMIVSDRVGAVGATDIVRSGENAIITPCGNARAIAATVRRLAQNPDTLQRMSQASLRIYSELDQRKSIEGLLAAGRFCLGGAGAPRRVAERPTEIPSCSREP